MMFKKFDKYDKYSILTLVISILICAYLTYRGVQAAKPTDDILLIIISIVSSIFSIGGLIIAVLQIFKVSGNTKTYKEAYDKTIEIILSNQSISLLSKSLEQLNAIKNLFENKVENSSRSYFNNLVLDLTYLKTNKKLDKLDVEKIIIYIDYCKKMDTLVYKSNSNVIEKVDFSVEYETLTDMQSLLISIQQKLNTPKEN